MIPIIHTYGTRIMAGNILSYRQTKLDSNNIRYNDYMRSLLAELDRLGLIKREELEHIKLDTMNALAEIINIWTNGESSSIMADTANDLMLSMLFNVDAYLIGAGNIDKAVALLLSSSVLNLYYEGIRRLKLYLCESTGLLVRVKRSRLSVPNVFYNETVDRALINALKYYDTKFASHKIAGELDYPLAMQSNTLRGIHYIRGYLINLYAENSFCREYDADELIKLYTIFCDKHKYPYNEPRVNIYSIIFVNALFNDYLRKEPGNLMLTEDECDVAETLLGSLTKEECANVLTGIASKMIGGNALYNVKMTTKIIPEILNALENKKLKNYLICIL